MFTDQLICCWFKVYNSCHQTNITTKAFQQSKNLLPLCIGLICFQQVEIIAEHGQIMYVRENSVKLKIILTTYI